MRFGSGRSGGHQERRPEDGVEAHDLLADQVQVGGPQVLALHRAHVGDQRVEPDVEDVRCLRPARGMPHLMVVRRDGEIVQALPCTKRDHFVAARLGLDEIGLRLVELEQPVLEGRELEEVVLLGDGLGGAAAVGAGIAGLGVVDVEFVEDAVLAGVGALVDVAVLAGSARTGPAPPWRCCGSVVRMEAVDAELEHLPLLRNSAAIASRELLRRSCRRARRRAPPSAPCSSVPVVSTAS